MSRSYFFSFPNAPPLHGKSSPSSSLIAATANGRANTATSSTVPASDTMYTNMANLQQTMLLQQRMFLQALCQQNALTAKNGTNGTTTDTTADIKHFIPPSLSQYRFVSGQQVCFIRCHCRCFFYTIHFYYFFLSFTSDLLENLKWKLRLLFPFKIGIHAYNPTAAKRGPHGMESKTSSGW